MIAIQFNTDEILEAFEVSARQATYATMLAINKTANQLRSELQTEMQRVFDRPTPWVMSSLRIKYATKARLVAELVYADKNIMESARSMIEPHVLGGTRHYKTMEARLFKAGILPEGWNVVPGAGAQLDGFGNMSQGQITQLLNVLQTYWEAGYNKADDRTVKRLAKGNKKKGTYGFTYWVNQPGGNGPGKHLQPGVYQRVSTGFGTSLKPVLIFVKRAAYKQRLDFYGIADRVVARDMQGNFREAFDQAMATAELRQSSLL